MQASFETVLASLRSSDPMRIQTALRTLKERTLKGNTTKMPPLGLDILDPFGGHIPLETFRDFLYLVEDNSMFEPPLSDREKVSICMAVMLRYGGKTQVTYDIALDVRIATDPARAVAMAMQEIVVQSLQSPESIAGAEHFVSCLLDGKPAVRKATLEALRAWPSEAPYTRVREYIASQLEPDELEFLKGA